MADPLLERVKQQASRPMFVYTIKSPLSDGIQEVALVQLTAREEILCGKRANGDTFQMGYEQVMLALVQVNGEKVSVGDGSADSWFNKMLPPTRQLVMAAFGNLHGPEEGAVQDFLQSRTVSV